MKCVFVFILFNFIAIASPESLPRRSLKSIPVVDALVQRLEREPWPDDTACYRDTLQILYGVRNDTLWATWVWDSMQPPLGVLYGTGAHLGNFDQCINTPKSSPEDLRTQYCLVDITAQPSLESREFAAYDSADEYLNTVTSTGQNLYQIGFGACMPSVCSPSSISKFYRHMLQMTYLPDAELIAVDPRDCQTSVPKPYPTKFFAYLYVLGALLVVVISSTIYTKLCDAEENSTIYAIAKSFSLTRNWSDLFKVNSNEIKVLNGIRFITSVLVVGCHQSLFTFFLPSMVTNRLEADTSFENEIGQGLTHIDLIVDTFFALSGLLLIRGLMNGKEKNLLVVLIKRYFRLIGPYAALTFYVLCVSRYAGSGPIWLRSISNEEGVCQKHWWRNFLMMVAWYVNCDYHLAILSVLLFWIYRRSKRSGIMTFTAVSFILTLQLVIKAYTNEMPLVLFNDFNKVADIRKYSLMNDVYIRWHDRAGSYFVGVVMGALMSWYKPAEHRHVISKTSSFIIITVSLSVMAKVATINYWFSGNPLAVAIAVATHRVFWAIAVCCVIAACEYLDAGIISDFLGSSVFVPLSKLTYSIYMVHFFVIQRHMHVSRSPFQFEPFVTAISILGTTMISASIALLLYILVEATCINLCNAYFSERKERLKQNKEMSVNGKKYLNETNGIHLDGANGFTKPKAA